jgi:hypothetical protein
MTIPPEQVKARAYLKERGTDAPIAEIRERVADAFAAMDALLESVDVARAALRPGDRDWSVHEVVDHLVETHPRALEEMRALMDDRHSPVSPIPAGLQSAHPMARPWDDLRATLFRLHREVLETLAAAPDRPTQARAPIIMVINVRQTDGRVTPLHWTELCDWKACAVIFRLHEMEHLSQIRKALRSGGA